ncbi:MAG: Methionyl-tRNA formyltransferase [Myxococcaceae bacterium]|nr:Methionyl-tRNA formyltransferase [Myxococcaceae bacterium]
MSSNVLRIAYFGLPLGALALARRGHLLPSIVLGHTDAVGARRVRRQLGRQALILARPELDDPAVVSAIASARPDVILSWFYPKQIPAAVLRLAPRGAFGAHPSLLPRWRGPDPYFWTILAGDLETGVSLHRLEAEYDTGAVVEQTSLVVDPEENAWRLAKRLDRPGLALLTRCAARLKAGESLAGTAQDERLATPAPAPDDAQLSISWRRPASEIVRLVRAAAPYPGATTELGDELVEVLKAELYEPPLPRALQPMDAVWSPRGLVICAGDGGVLIREVRDADGAVLSGEQLEGLFPDALARIHLAGSARSTQSTSGKR